MTELPGAGYLKRTRQNVLDSSGTLIIHFGAITGGTLKAVQLCQRFGKPFLPIKERAIRVLNVAGPRESGHAGARDFAESVVHELLRRCQQDAPVTLRA